MPKDTNRGAAAAKLASRTAIRVGQEVSIISVGVNDHAGHSNRSTGLCGPLVASATPLIADDTVRNAYLALIFEMAGVMPMPSFCGGRTYKSD